MNRLLYLVMIASYLCYLPSCKQSQTDAMETPIHIIPMPQAYKLSGGTSVLDHKSIALDKEFSAIKEVVSVIGKGKIVEQEANIHIVKNNDLNSEAYQLEIQNNKVKISASSPRGVIYALQSLSQLYKEDGKTLSNITINDQPRFNYRGMHLDVARHFFSIDDVKKYIDLLSEYKFNTFHWHLTDDQGWRIEIKKYPLLTTISAYRQGTLIGHYNDNPQKYDQIKYGGYYTQDEIRDVVSYAMIRGIEVIPEIEMPGHATAAIAAYPELGCTGKPTLPAMKWGVFDDVFCPNEKTFQFLQDVLDEVMTLFPSKYIHIGGDECPKTNWKQSNFCQNLMKKENIKDELELQSYFIKRIDKYVTSKGKNIIGWDEILEGGLSPNATVMSWRGTDGGIEAARQKHNVIMTPTDFCYLDYYQSLKPGEPLSIGGYLPLEKVYGYDPIPSQLNKEEHKYIIGVQANIWTEYIKDFNKLMYMALPRMQAMAEVGWTRPEHKNLTSFNMRLKAHFTKWKKAGLNFANKSNDVQIAIASGDGSGVAVSAVNSAALTNIINVDGRINKVTNNQKIYLQKSGLVTICAEDNQGLKGYTDTIHFHKHLASGRKITMSHQPADKYKAHGIGSLINGVTAPDNNYGNEWLGFEGQDCEIVIDLGDMTAINNIKTRFYNGPGQWIYPPQYVSILLSQNNENFNEVPAFLVPKSSEKIIPFSVPIANTKARYIKLIIKNHGKIGIGLQGEGHGAWLFVDEIVVE